MADSSRWTDAQRLEGWAGEARLNLFRVAALVAFYSTHLLNVYVFTEDPQARGDFHTSVTTLTLAWAASAVALHFCLLARRMPVWLPYAVTAVDLLMITAALVISPEGPRSFLIVLYFLVIAGAPLRLSLPVVWLATIGAMSGYAFVLGDWVWRRVGWDAYYAEGGPRLPRVQQLSCLLALGVAGLLAGQVVRQVRRIMEGHGVVVIDDPPPGG